ncbi:MAG: hypothetical protein U1F83_07940 [Verrucomicrobiota bacterium]
MHTLSQRIEVQFPQRPAAATLIGVTNHGVTILGRNPEARHDAKVSYRVLPIANKSPERRGIPESALHD